MTLDYDLEGRLSSATISRVEEGHNVQITSAYEYSQSGIRTKATSTTTIDAGTPYDTTRVFLNDGMNHTGYSQILEELPAFGGTPTRSYVIGDDVIGQADSSGAEWFAHDAQGSARLLTGAEGLITERLSYDAFGVALGEQPNVVSPLETNLAYCGEFLDHELGMGYNRARYYDMQTGVWNRLDPADGIKEVPQSLHKYVYCCADPTNGYDPTGEAASFNVVGQVFVTAVNTIIHAISTAAVAAFKWWAQQKIMRTLVFGTIILGGYLIASWVDAANVGTVSWLSMAGDMSRLDSPTWNQFLELLTQLEDNNVSLSVLRIKGHGIYNEPPQRMYMNAAETDYLYAGDYEGGKGVFVDGATYVPDPDDLDANNATELLRDVMQPRTGVLWLDGCNTATRHVSMPGCLALNVSKALPEVHVVGNRNYILANNWNNRNWSVERVTYKNGRFVFNAQMPVMP